MRTGVLLLLLTLSLLSCREKAPPPPPFAAEGEVLLQVGTILIRQPDLDYHLREKHGGRKGEATRAKALEELAERARWTQAAIDAGLANDPVFRSEAARILSSRLRESELAPQLRKASEPVPEERLRAIYDKREEQFISPEKRRVAVLWLNPGPDPERAKEYTEKLANARRWFFEESDLATKPEQGFSVLAIDHSEHAASRYKGGEVGWFEAGGGTNDWERKVAQTVFSLENIGDVSGVITAPEGIFLLRLMGVRPSIQRDFESVRAALEKEEQRHLRTRAEEAFSSRLREKYPDLVP